MPNIQGDFVVLFTRENFKLGRERALEEVGSELNAVRTKDSISPSSVRYRPHKGFMQWEMGNVDPTVAPGTTTSISVTTAGGGVRSLRNGVGFAAPESTTTLSPAYNDFIITRASHNRAEKNQIVQTFGEPFVYFFGQEPMMLQADGYLLNTPDFPWLSEWLFNYENELRGTKLIEHNARAYLNIGLSVYEGYFMNYNLAQVAGDELRVPFSFTFFVTNVTHVPEAYFGNWHQLILTPRTTEGYSSDEDPWLTALQSMGSTVAQQFFAAMKGGDWKNFALSSGLAVAGATINFALGAADDAIEGAIYGDQKVDTQTALFGRIKFSSIVKNVATMAVNMQGAWRSGAAWLALTGSLMNNLFNSIEMTSDGFDSLGGSSFVEAGGASLSMQQIQEFLTNGGHVTSGAGE